MTSKTLRLQPILRYCAPLLLAVLTALAQNNASWLPVGEPVVGGRNSVAAKWQTHERTCFGMS